VKTLEGRERQERIEERFDVPTDLRRERSPEVDPRGERQEGREPETELPLDEGENL